MDQRKKVLLDTDIGSDIDDAVCLAYLLRQPLCELVGITTVTGEPVKRAMLASALCKAAGKGDIPIYPGSPEPLLQKQAQPASPQAEALRGMDYQADFPMQRHISFMIDTIRANPGEITLLAIGPMTNVALLFAVDPEIPSLLKELVLMCGVFSPAAKSSGDGREWNALVDAFATAMVYRAAVPVHRSFGLDVTNRVKMPPEEVRSRFQQDILRLILPMSEVWFHEREEITFHDPLTAVSLFCGDVCRMQRGAVSVELGDTPRLGETYWRADPENGRHEAAFDVNTELFFEEYFKVFR